MNLPLANNSWGDEELQAIQQVVDSGRFTSGDRVKEYERNFADYFGAKYCVMVNSGSSANLLAVAALFFRKQGSLEQGDEVIVPAVGWSTSYSPLHQYGLKLKFVDIDPLTLNYDLNSLEDAISGTTKLILAINLLGNPNDFAKIEQLIGGRNISIIEDNCESMGATYNGKQAGTFGEMGTFSTFFSHHISTMEGGCIVTDDEELHQILICLRSHGWTRELVDQNHVHEHSDSAFQNSFYFVLPGYNLRPIEIEGAIGIEQLKKLPKFVEARKKNARTFTELFHDHRSLTIQKEIGESSWFGFAITLQDHVSTHRDTIVENLKQQGIESRPVVTGNFLRNPVVKWFNYVCHGETPNADRVHDRAFFVGNHHTDISPELHYLKEQLATL